MATTVPDPFQLSQEDRRRAFFWWMLLLASGLASLASFWTTFVGLNLYTPWALALASSLAVQAGMFALAWFMGLASTRLRPLLILLFSVMMTFSMLFSYVTFHSHLSRVAASKSSQEKLIDRLRHDLRATTALFTSGVEEGEVLRTKLQDWQQIEATRGWVTDVCENESHCYLEDVCGRLQGAIAEWERRHQRAYRQGPGQQLIYELFASEVNTLESKRELIRGFLGSLDNHNGLFIPETDNLARITEYDTLIESAPLNTLTELLCVEEVEIPVAPDYQDFSRDRALSEQLPAYSFDDLLALWDGKRDKDDLWTLLALGLAIFLDLFVLVVALAGSPMFYRQEEAQGSFPLKDKVPAAWNEDLKRRVEEWAGAVLPGAEHDLTDRVAFVQRVIAATRVTDKGDSLLVPATEEMEGLGRLLVAEGAATPRSVLRQGEEVSSFTLADWILPALTRYLRLTTEVAE